MSNPTYTGLLASKLSAGNTPKRKIFISYHHKGDQYYYNTLSTAFSSTYEIIQDNSLDRQIDSNDPEYVMRKIREDYISGTSCTLVLCGADTPYRKFVDWEIKATLDKQHALVGVYLPTARKQTGTILTPRENIIVPDRFYANHQSGFALFVSWERIYDLRNGLKHIVEKAVQHAKSNPQLITNNEPLMSRNR